MRMFTVKRAGAWATLATVAAFLSLSCASGGTGSGSSNPTQIAFAPELGVFLDQMTRTDEGLYYHDLALGTGEEAGSNDRVTIHYNGFLPDGTPFDSSVARDEPIQFVLGMREVVQGWEIGVRGMKEGGRRLLVIPPDLGYGSRGLSGVVPGNATLVFEVQLLEVGE